MSSMHGKKGVTINSSKHQLEFLPSIFLSLGSACHYSFLWKDTLILKSGVNTIKNDAYNEAIG